jgi:hypothetical protein
LEKVRPAGRGNDALVTFAIEDDGILRRIEKDMTMAACCEVLSRGDEAWRKGVLNALPMVIEYLR